MTKNLTKFAAEKKIIFFAKGLHSALKREHPELQKM
jgi:hypothetical protein